MEGIRDAFQTMRILAQKFQDNEMTFDEANCALRTMAFYVRAIESLDIGESSVDIQQITQNDESYGAHL